MVVLNAIVINSQQLLCGLFQMIDWPRVIFTNEITTAGHDSHQFAHWGNGVGMS